MRPRSRAAFTLVEMTVVVVLLGLTTAAVVVSFARPIERARAQDALDRVRSLDEAARVQAKRSGRAVQIVFDLSHGTLGRRDATGESVFEASLPDEFEIDRFRSAAGDDVSSGEAVAACSPLGLTRSYAVRLVGPADVQRWVLFAGLTGEMVVVRDEAMVNSILGDDAR